MYNTRLRYGEVLYFFQHKIGNNVHTLAVVSLYGLENALLLAESSGTVWACQAQGDDTLVVIDVKTILTCIAMVPHTFVIPNTDPLQLFLAMDKIGAEIGNMGEAGDDSDDDDDDDGNDDGA